MKKYIVKYKHDKEVFSEYNSREEASAKLMEYIDYCNTGSKGEYISPFDFYLEEVECKEVNEVITNFYDACQYLRLPTNKAKIDNTEPANWKKLGMLEKFTEEINPKHIEALIALNRLFTIAEAWNKAEGFVPDFSDWDQAKYYPWFKYDKDAAGVVCANTNYAPTYAYAPVGSRLCFKSSARAAQFGKQYEELYNKVFL